MIDQKPKRKWQNLLYQKCPNCDARMEDRNLYFMCPTAHTDDPTKSCFFIKKDKVAEYLLDTNHPAYYCLTESERSRITETIESFNISLPVDNLTDKLP